MNLGTEDHVARMEMQLLPRLRPGQVWLVRRPTALNEPAFVLLAPRPPGDPRWRHAPYDVLRSHVRLGALPVRAHGSFAELDVLNVGHILSRLRQQKELLRSSWTQHLFECNKRPLFYERLFSYEPWEPHD